MPLTPQITLTANLEDLTGVAAGSTANPARLVIALVGYGRALPQIAGTATLARIDITQYSTGSPISVQLWGNDVIIPLNQTYYSITVMDGEGNIVQAANYQFTGTQTVDLSSATPYYPAPPNPPALPVAANTVYSGPVSGAAAAPNFRKLVSADLPVATSVAPGAVEPDNTSITITSGGVISAVGAPPSGAAGGDLSGTYPNPLVQTYSGGYPIAGSQAVQHDAYNFAYDVSSTANVYQINLNPTVTLAIGTRVSFVSNSFNTGPATLSVNAGPAKAIHKNSGAALTGGEIAYGQIVYLTYDPSGYWQMPAVSPNYYGTGNQVVATPASGSTGYSTLRTLAPADLPVATTAALGAVKPDGTTITIASGVISAAAATPPLTVGFVMNTGATGTSVGPLLLAARAGTLNSLVVVTKSSDGSTALTLDILKNGTSVFTSTKPNVAAGTSSGTVSTFTNLTSTPLSVAKGDVFQINITSGTSNWVFTAQLET